MKFYADLHIHSKYSRATSGSLDLENLWLWAQLKGIKLVATGDCLHPAWLSEIKSKLVECGNGFFELKKEYCSTIEKQIPKSCRANVYFVLSTEISSIYKYDGKVRKVHNVIYLPDIVSVEKLAVRLEEIGNIRSDGRPILGLDCRSLLEIVLSCNANAMFVPAHIWTPWFSVLGSKSGFDSLQECFGDLTRYIYAVETGLSSDPPMNWRLSSLDDFFLISNSDAHSPDKLGREANIFDAEISYVGFLDALRGISNNNTLLGTIEFFPEEGKYHYDGHRNCKVRMNPKETIKNKGLCPVCKKPVTVGVMSRVEELANRKEGEKGLKWKPYKSLIPLVEIIAESFDICTVSKKAKDYYHKLINNIGNEFFILLDSPLSQIENASNSVIAEGIRRVRGGEVTISAGYDGEYGTIKIFNDRERSSIAGQTMFFDFENKAPSLENQQESLLVNEQIFDKYDSCNQTNKKELEINKENRSDKILNKAQQDSVDYNGLFLIIQAGPGTGKTHTLVYRIAKTLQRCNDNKKILAITFTNKASEETKERLAGLLEIDSKLKNIFIGTFHGFCVSLLRKYYQLVSLPQNFLIATQEQQKETIKKAFEKISLRKVDILLDKISKEKSFYKNCFSQEVQIYNRALHESGYIDYDDIIILAVRLILENDSVSKELHSLFKHIFVDEFQDINSAQYELLKLLVKDGVSITVIGDPNQAIYGFRGSDYRFFEKFEKDFIGSKKIILTENYRNSKNLLIGAGNVICGGNLCKSHSVVSKLSKNGKIIIHEAESDKHEAEYIVNSIENLIGGTSLFYTDTKDTAQDKEEYITFGDFAILFRTNAVAEVIVDAFEKKGIPYEYCGNKHLYEYDVVRAVCSFLKTAKSQSNECSDFCKFIKTNKNLQIDNILNDARTFLNQNDIKSAILTLKSLPCFWSRVENNKDNSKAFSRVLNISGNSNNIEDFFDYIILDKSYDMLDIKPEKVSLLTLHASKGLEFGIVFIAGCENGIIPISREKDEVDIEEERRLFYVGMTRAKSFLYLTYCKRRLLYDKTIYCSPSPFILNIQENIKTYEKSIVKNKECEQISFIKQLFDKK